MYTDSSSSFSLEARLWSPFQTPLERLPLIWPSIPNTRTRWSSRTSLCLPMASLAPASSLQALWLCADHFWDLFCYRLRWLVHWDRNVSPTREYVSHGGCRIEGAANLPLVSIFLEYSPMNRASLQRSTSVWRLCRDNSMDAICRSPLGQLYPIMRAQPVDEQRQGLSSHSLKEVN